MPEPKENRNKDSTFDALLSRLAVIREDDYVKKRKQFENKPIKLLTYEYTQDGQLILNPIL